MLIYDDKLPSEAFVKEVSRRTGFRWSRTTLAQLLEYGVIKTYYDVTKPGSQRQRILYGREAFQEVILFMLVKSLLPYMSRGKNPNELDATNKKDTLKFRLYKNAGIFIDNNYSSPANYSLADLTEYIDQKGLVDKYLVDNSNIGAFITSKAEYESLKKKFREVIICFFFFKNLIDGTYSTKGRGITDSWDYLCEEILPTQYAIPNQIDHNSLLAGCYWLSSNLEKVSGDIKVFCNIINQAQYPNGKAYTCSDELRDELVSYARLAVRFGPSNHYLSSLCHSNLVSLGLDSIKEMRPDNFSIVAPIIFLSSGIVSANLPEQMKLRRHFTVK